MNKILATIYPFNFESVVIARYKELIKDIDIISGVLPYDLTDKIKNVSFFDEGRYINTSIYSYSCYKNEINKCDTILWADYNYVGIKDFFEMVINDIKNAMIMKKNIICLQTLRPEEKDEMISFANSQSVNFIYYNYSQVDYSNFQCETLEDISVPVIMNYGMLENSMKFNTQLSLKKIFEKEGYKISQIGTKHYSQLFNIHPYPKFMFDINISNKLKILYFNAYVNEIVNKEKSDLCIIGVPGEIMPYNDKFNFNFGIMAYMVSWAVKSDYTILNNHYVKINDEYINGLKNLFKYKFGNKLHSLVLSNIRVNEDSYQNGESEYEHEIIRINNYPEYKDSDICIVNITDPEFEIKLLEHIYNQLSNSNERIV